MYRASRLEGILGFSVVSIILANLLGNRCSFQRFQKVTVVIYGWWISIRFYFKVRCLCMRVLFRAIIGLFAAVLLIFSFFLFLGLTCNNKAKSSYFRRQKYYRDFLRYFKQSRVILNFVFAANSVVIWKPKIPSMFAKRAARYSEYCCKQRNSRNVCPKTSGDMSCSYCKTGHSWKDGLDTRTPTWTALFTWRSARELARIRPCTLWHVYARWAHWGI